MFEKSSLKSIGFMSEAHGERSLRNLHPGSKTMEYITPLYRGHRISAQDSPGADEQISAQGPYSA